ncbi:hypothetical protein ACLB2K_020368 [Fragaria x ananassa]
MYAFWSQFLGSHHDNFPHVRNLLGGYLDHDRIYCIEALLFIFGFLSSLSLSLHPQSGTLIHLSPCKTDPTLPGPELMDCKSNTDQNGYCGFYIQDFVVDHSHLT